MTELRWHFPILDQGEEDGFNDPLQEHFQGNHEYYIARETIQNALDAKPEGSTVPVKIQFEIMPVRTSELPGADGLSKYIDSCIDYNKGDSKAVGFFESARRLLEKDTIQLLRIGDYNTTGLKGGDTRKEGGNWYKLVKAVGKNEMAGEGGGSFGIGKGAPFAASKLKYVLYSTRTAEGTAFQGKAKLTSFSDEDGVDRRGTGFWGDNGHSAIRSPEDIPRKFYREDIGTDVYVTGYEVTDDWMGTLIRSVLENFWAAVHFGSLQVEFIEGDRSKSINSENLSAYLEIFETDKPKENPWYYYKAVTEPTQVFETKLRTIGKVQLYVKTEDNYPRAIQMMRGPKMAVRTTGPHHVLPEEYAGVMKLDDGNDAGNKLLRKLEPPKHDMWDPYRGKAAGIDGWAIIRELDAWVRASLRSMNNRGAVQLDEVPGLNKMLPEKDLERDDLISYSDDGEKNDDKNKDESAEEKTVMNDTVLPKRPERKPISLQPSGTGGSKPRVPKTGGSGTGGGPGGGAGDESGGTRRMDTTDLTVRAFPIGDPANGKYKIVLHAPTPKSGSIKLIGAGDDADYPFVLNSAQSADGIPLSVDGSFISNISVQPNKPLAIIATAKTKRLFAFSVGVENHVG